MTHKDFSHTENLCQQFKKQQGKKPKKGLSSEGKTPYWIELIDDLVFGAGYSYSRIAYRIGVAPSTIQKLATNPKRKPCLKVFHPLVALHFKVFQGQYITPREQEYWATMQAAKNEILG